MVSKENNEVDFEMRSITEKFTDEEFEALTAAKGKTSWHNFIMSLVKKQ